MGNQICRAKFCSEHKRVNSQCKFPRSKKGQPGKISFLLHNCDRWLPPCPCHLNLPGCSIKRSLIFSLILKLNQKMSLHTWLTAGNQTKKKSAELWLVVRQLYGWEYHRVCKQPSDGQPWWEAEWKDSPSSCLCLLSPCELLMVLGF